MGVACREIRRDVAALGGGSSGSVSFNGTKFDVTSPTVDTGEVYVTSSMLQ